MADYAKINLRMLYSKSSDYSTPKADTKSLVFELTPDVYTHREMNVPTVTTTILAQNEDPTALTGMLIVNNDATYAVYCDYTDSDDNANSVWIPAGRFAYIPDVDGTAAAVTLTADTAACEVEYFLIGT